MRILANIETKKEQGEGWVRYPGEVLEVEVVRVLRHRADRYRDRYYYEADVVPPEKLHPEVASFAVREGLLRVNVMRKLNPRWKPPVFEAGKNLVVIAP